MTSPDTTANAVNAITEIHDIRGPVGIPGEWLWLWITLGAVLAALGVVAAVLALLRRKRTPVEPPKRPA